MIFESALQECAHIPHNEMNFEPHNDESEIQDRFNEIAESNLLYLATLFDATFFPGPHSMLRYSEMLKQGGK